MNSSSNTNGMAPPAINNPLRVDAFCMTEDQKISLIAKHFQEIMEVLGLDLSDDSLEKTPERVARMYVRETFSGLDPKNKPVIKLFENKYRYNEMLVEKDITLYSVCEHHFVPIVGKAHMAYISNGTVIGLSKINRVVRYFARRPQVQERLTNQIAEAFMDILATPHVAIVIEADHLCVASRGIMDTNNKTITANYSGRFKTDADLRLEFLSLLNKPVHAVPPFA